MLRFGGYTVLFHRFKIIFFLIVLTGHSEIVTAQPESYWNENFNTEASLLAGSVVGGNSGITSIYYNPAGISEIEDQQFALNASLMSLDNTKYKNALGGGSNLSYLRFHVVPRFVSYLYRLRSDTTISLQFAIFSKDNSHSHLYSTVDYKINLFPDSNGDNYYGSFNLLSDYSDYWGGIGASRQLTNRITVGASLFVSIKTFTYEKYIDIIVSPDKQGLYDSLGVNEATWSASQRLVMYNVRLLGKVGFRYEGDRFSLGLNISTPSGRILGNADAEKILAQSNIPDEEGRNLNYSYHEVARYLLAHFKDPFSVAFGAHYTSPTAKYEYYVTVEYFNKINLYKTVDGTINVKPENNSSKPSTDFLSYYYEAKSTVNVALGLKQSVNDKISMIYGFKTNFNPKKNIFNNAGDESNFEFSTVIASQYFLSTGASIRFKKGTIITGLQFGYSGKRDNLQFVNFYDPVPFDWETGLALQGERTYAMNYSMISLSLFLGFTLGF